jgi:hypothetical protein
LVSLVVTQDNQSVSSSITGATGINRLGTKHGSVTLHQDVVIILSSDTTKLPIPIAIHSPMAHVTLQMGLSNKERDCPALKCVFDSGAALNTANFHFMEAVIHQYPHILKKIYLPDNYAAIILSGIVNTPDSTPITTKLNVGFDIHLPYTTMDGNNTSLLVAAGPDVAVNLILGLPFIKATGMIADFVDNVCEAKNLLCDLFPSISNAQQNPSLFLQTAQQSLNLTAPRRGQFYKSSACSGPSRGINPQPEASILHVNPCRGCTLWQGHRFH